MRENLTILKKRSSSGATHVPSQPSTFPSPRTTLCPRFWIAARYTEYLWVHQETFSNDYLLNKTNFCSLWQFKELGILFSRIETWYRKYQEAGEWHVTRAVEYVTLVPRFQSAGGLINHTGGTYSHGGMIDYPRFSISLLHLGNFPDSVIFHCWKVIFKTDVCRNQQIKEVEQAKTIDEPMTSRSIVGETIAPTAFFFLRCFCVCIEKTSRQSYSLPQKRKCRRAACSKYDDSYEREKIALHDVRAFPCNRRLWSGTRTLRFVQHAFADDDVQDFDVWWCQALLSANEMPSDVILEGLCKLNYRTLFSFRLSWLCTIKETVPNSG